MKTSDVSKADERLRKAIIAASEDKSLVDLRRSLATAFAVSFKTAGEILHIEGHIFGTDRLSGSSPFGHGRDEAVGVSLLLRISSQLISGVNHLIDHRLLYAGAALIRQLVEVEYLAWAFDTRDKDAEKWLRSDRNIREEFFRPYKLRAAASGKFRGKDYGYHCEYGGHPTPLASVIIKMENPTVQLFVADMIGHAVGIWDHLYSWSSNETLWGEAFAKSDRELRDRITYWKAHDPLANLPTAR